MLVGPGQPLPGSFPEGMGVRREGAKGAQAAWRNGPRLASLVVAALVIAAPSGCAGRPLGALGHAQAAKCLQCPASGCLCTAQPRDGALPDTLWVTHSHEVLTQGSQSGVRVEVGSFWMEGQGKAQQSSSRTPWALRDSSRGNQVPLPVPKGPPHHAKQAPPVVSWAGIPGLPQHPSHLVHGTFSGFSCYTRARSPLPAQPGLLGT